MKNKTTWIIAFSAFMLGYLVNEYRHQSNSLHTAATNTQAPIVHAKTQQHSSPFHSAASRNIVTTPPVFSWEHLHQLTGRQEYNKAIELLNTWLRDNPADTQAWYWLAMCYQSQGKLALAVDSWFEYLALEHDTSRTQHAIENLKRLLQQLGQNRPANNNNAPWLMEQINKLLDVSINDHQLHLMLAQLHFDTGDNYQAQYHALMAANHPDTEPQAEKILAQLNGDIADEPMQLSLTRYGEQFIVTVYIEGKPANLLLDTGASISGVTSRYTAKYPSIVKQTKPIRLNTASGTKDSYLLTVDELHMGDARFERHMLAVLPMDDLTEFDGLLGVDILGKFDFVIDQNNATLTLNPRQ